MYQSKTTRRTVCTYNHDYTKEFMDVEAREIPCHRLLLLPEHFEDTHRIFYVTSSWLGKKMSNWKLAQAILVTLTQAQFDEVFCTTESSAWYILFMKATGLLKLPVVVVNVAMLRPSYRQRLICNALGHLLKHATSIVSYASFQQPLLLKVFGVPLDKQRFTKFQVDSEFIQKNRSINVSNFILSVGTNEGRDYRTLMQVITPQQPLIVCTDLRNKEIIIRSQNYNSEKHLVLLDVPYRRLLELYSECRLFISCLHDVEYSTGQTVIQEALELCQKVIVSDVRSVSDYIVADENVITVQGGSVSDYEAAISRFFS
jgi:hypothetical protein